MIATAPVPPKQNESWEERFAGTRRYTIDEYHRMLDAGILYDGEPVELLEGLIFYKDGHIPAPDPNALFPAWRPLRRWTVDEYDRMVEVGILTTDDRVELLDGYVVLKMPQNIPHRASVVRLVNRFPRHLPEGWTLMSQCPAVIDHHEPEPDGAVLRGIDSDYDHRAITPSDIGMVIEVADSSLGHDRGSKQRMYATAGIPVYWIVNLVDRQIEVYTDPDASATPPAYATRTDYLPGRDVPIILDGQQVGTIPAVDLLP